jgi:di-heme oxidoreductase (putative peroxidase)
MKASRGLVSKFAWWRMRRPSKFVVVLSSALAAVAAVVLGAGLSAQMIDNTQAINPINAGINKSLTQEIGASRGSINTPDSSLFIINRDAFRAVRRGRQLFQRKFTRVQGQGPGIDDGVGNIATTIGIGAGLVDSCAGCHARPRGSAGFGGDVVTRPDSRNVPHLFGLGIKEMLADEMTSDLRAIRSQAIASARSSGQPVTLPLATKGVSFGSITGRPDGSVDTSQVQGVNPDLRIRPFFAHGGTISMREFIVGALHAEMGLEAVDPDLATASAGGRVVTPSGMVLDGSQDAIEAPPPPDPNNGNEIDVALVDHLEFYLLNYFKPGLGQQDPSADHGLRVFNQLGCATCHVQNLTINHDRRVADVNTVYDPVKGIFNRLFATATPLIHTVNDGTGNPPLMVPNGQPFLVQNIFTDFKRHDLGPNFHERNWDGTFQTLFLTRPLWGVGSLGSLGHDGRSINLTEVILRHGGEAQASRDAFANLFGQEQQNGDQGDAFDLLHFLGTLVIFPPDDTASNLDPGNPAAANFPQSGHGSIKLTVLFNNPHDPE